MTTNKSINLFPEIIEKKEHENLILNVIKAIIGEFVVGPIFTNKQYGFIKDILSIIILFLIYFLIDSIYKYIKQKKMFRNDKVS